MTSTSGVATARVAPGIASRPSPPPGNVAYSWRALRTGVAFIAFGVGATVVARILWPLRLLARPTTALREVHAQRCLHRALHLFAWFMEGFGLIPVSWNAA